VLRAFTGDGAILALKVRTGVSNVPTVALPLPVEDVEDRLADGPVTSD